ncbi:hypothetical protein GWI33_003614 [Rhynchophorus ferrugineus]|uniref:Uncharacterized protein n=1 Tax=Rhynchophorus ferrugineus TaxID=354439 RepID=A0A834HIT0_RHYFE|nr:hypothetical protein GWI33_003614 [Rhynchophorus ferrugineus]
MWEHVTVEVRKKRENQNKTVVCIFDGPVVACDRMRCTNCHVEEEEVGDGVEGSGGGVDAVNGNGRTRTHLQTAAGCRGSPRASRWSKAGPCWGGLAEKGGWRPKAHGRTVKGRRTGRYGAAHDSHRSEARPHRAQRSTPRSKRHWSDAGRRILVLALTQSRLTVAVHTAPVGSTPGGDGRRVADGYPRDPFRNPAQTDGRLF